MRMFPSYLTGHEAIDVSRMTGLPLAYCGTRIWDEPDIAADAAEDAVARGLWELDEVMLDMTRLSFWDRWRVTWARLGAMRWLQSQLTPDELLAMVGE